MRINKLITTILKTGRGGPAPKAGINIIFDGDSLTSGDGSSGGLTYPAQAATLLGATYPPNEIQMANLGRGGVKIADLNAPAWITNVTGRSQPNDWGKNIVAVWIGTNDIASSTAAATVYSGLTSYIASCKAAGLKVAVLTTINRSGFSGGIETARVAYNNLIKANSAGADFIVDVAADAAFSNTGNTTYYSGDGIHLSNTGYGVIANLVVAAIL